MCFLHSFTWPYALLALRQTCFLKVSATESVKAWIYKLTQSWFALSANLIKSQARHFIRVPYFLAKKTASGRTAVGVKGKHFIVTSSPASLLCLSPLPGYHRSGAFQDTLSVEASKLLVWLSLGHLPPPFGAWTSFLFLKLHPDKSMQTCSPLGLTTCKGLVRF